MAAQAEVTDDLTTPRPHTGDYPSEVDPISQLKTGDLSQERFTRAQKPKPQRKDGVRPADITVGNLDPSSPLKNASFIAATSRRRNSSPFSSGTSPSRLGKSSPRHLSPATSQIFERDVQESTILAPELSPAIPSHITTEDHIPPVLEASSLVITDNYDPDEVEIVRSIMHQPAATSVVQSGLSDSAHASHADLANATSLSHSSLPGGLSSEGFAPTSVPPPVAIPRSSPPPPAPPGLYTESSEEKDNNSAYNAVDPTDPRRLSFISFADVVNAEHVEMANSQSFSDGTMLSHSSAAPSIAGNRSPSPVRSPIIPASPHTRALAAGEASPVRGTTGSFLSSSVPGTAGVHATGPHTELTVETMRQTLQKTGSNDVPGVSGGGSGTGSQPMSATSAEDVTQPFAK